MRRSLVSLVYLALIIAQTALAQPNPDSGPPCTDPACISAVYSYMFCDRNGTLIHKCSADPNHEPGLKMYKRSIPLALCPDFSGARYGRVYLSASDPLGPREIDFFIPANVEARMREAASRWNAICPPQGPNKEYQGCCLKVFWSRSLLDMDRHHALSLLL